MQRREIVFRGQVQGVGFRYTTRHIAEDYQVSGYVRNLPDGTVELVAEGSAAELDDFLAELERRMGEYIRERRVARLAASGEFAGFDIRH